VRRAYRRDGYVALRGFLPARRAAALGRALVAVFADSFGEAAPASLDAAVEGGWLRTLFARDPGRFWKTSRAAQESAEIAALTVRPGLVAALRNLGLARPAVALRPHLVWAANWMERAGAHSLRPMHQDWERCGGSVDSVVAWIPLTSAEAGRFPLRVRPGSHRDGVYRHAPHRDGIRIDDPRFDPEDRPAATLEAAPGDLVILSSLLVHASGAGDADALRVAVSCRYNNLADPFYAARGYPSGVRTAPVKNRSAEEFPSAEDIAAAFGEG